MEKIYLWDTTPPYFDGNILQDTPSLTPFIAERSKKEKTGAVIVCAGGSYIVKTKHEGIDVAESFAENGFTAFNLDYRVYPYDHKAILSDVRRAVKWVRYHAEEYNVDPEKICVIGFSAGGHLATLSATNYDSGFDGGDEIDKLSSRPDAAIISYAVISMVPPFSHEHSRYVLIGRENAEKRGELMVKYSGELAADENTPPVFLWHTADDGCVEVENSINLASALSRHKVPFEMHIFDKGPHSLGMAKDFPGAGQWGALAFDWLMRMGF
ncbi:MAG: alpha/beta hydrolase [Clostridia bacterium]|nr:alpha/beta hydrolase [Clostridia bacterium]